MRKKNLTREVVELATLRNIPLDLCQEVVPKRTSVVVRGTRHFCGFNCRVYLHPWKRCSAGNLPFGPSTIALHSILLNILNATVVERLLGFDEVVVLLLGLLSFLSDRAMAAMTRMRKHAEQTERKARAQLMALLLVHSLLILILVQLLFTLLSHSRSNEYHNHSSGFQKF